VLLNHFDIEDPIIKTARVWVEGQTETLHREGLGEEEILEKLTLQWEASRIRAAWADIWKWSTNRLAALEKQEGEEGS
jgi:hypothetical protein